MTPPYTNGPRNISNSVWWFLGGGHEHLLDDVELGLLRIKLNESKNKMLEISDELHTYGGEFKRFCSSLALTPRPRTIQDMVEVLGDIPISSLVDVIHPPHDAFTPLADTE